MVLIIMLPFQFIVVYLVDISCGILIVHMLLNLTLHQYRVVCLMCVLLFLVLLLLLLLLLLLFISLCILQIKLPIQIETRLSF